MATFISLTLFGILSSIPKAGPHGTHYGLPFSFMFIGHDYGAAIDYSFDVASLLSNLLAHVILLLVIYHHMAVYCLTLRQGKGWPNQ